MHTRGRRGHGGVHVSLPFVTPHLWSIVAKFGQASGRLNLLTPLRPPPALVRKGTLWPEVGFTSASFYAQLGSVLQDARLLVYARSWSTRLQAVQRVEGLVAARKAALAAHARDVRRAPRKG